MDSGNVFYDHTIVWISILFYFSNHICAHNCRIGDFRLTDADLHGPEVRAPFRTFCAALAQDIASHLDEQVCKAAAVGLQQAE